MPDNDHNEVLDAGTGQIPSGQPAHDPVPDVGSLHMDDMVASPSTASHTDNWLDLEALRLPQDFEALTPVKQLLTEISVGRPSPQAFIRTHPDDSYRLMTMVLEDKATRDTYLVHPALWQALSGELTRKVLFTGITRQNILFLWPVRLPDEFGRLDRWNLSALEAAHLAQARWIRVVSNWAQGAYTIFEALGCLPEPEWPEVSFQEIVTIAFNGKYITDLQHPVVQKLRGEI